MLCGSEPLFQEAWLGIDIPPLLARLVFVPLSLLPLLNSFPQLSSWTPPQTGSSFQSSLQVSASISPFQSRNDVMGRDRLWRVMTGN